MYKLQETVIVVLKCIREKCYQCWASIKMALYCIVISIDTGYHIESHSVLVGRCTKLIKSGKL